MMNLEKLIELLFVLFAVWIQLLPPLARHPTGEEASSGLSTEWEVRIR
jgi:hypothetical protein